MKLRSILASINKRIHEEWSDYFKSQLITSAIRTRLIIIHYSVHSVEIE